ncbi:MAG: hypothetical protein IKA02_05045 [Clostridia bacterium]|nr:hypothetical protein [Clostridia bacterium]
MYLTALQNDSTVLIIWAVCIGVVIGFVGNFVSKAIAGPFVRALLSEGAVGEDNAISLREAGFLYRKLLAFNLRDGSSLRNTVSVVGGTLPRITANGKTAIDYEKALFYIPKTKKEKAQNTFGEKEKWYILPVFIILAIICAYGMSTVMPLLVEALFK